MTAQHNAGQAPAEDDLQEISMLEGNTSEAEAGRLFAEKIVETFGPVDMDTFGWQDVVQRVTGHRYTKTNAVVFFSLILLAGVGASAFLIVGLKSIWHSPRGSLDGSSPTLEGFQRGSTVRGTMDIVFGCLSAMAICTYTVTHPDLPLIPLHRLSFKEKLRSSQWWWMQITTSIEFLSTLVAPESALASALEGYMRAQQDVAFMHAHDHQEWSLKHAFFAQMGGFRTSNDLVHLSGRQLLEVAPEQLSPRRLRAISDEISDKEKADVLAKAFTIWLLLRFAFGIVARGAAGVPITPLEFVTCAYIPHTLATYYFCFEKPYKVREPIYLGAKPVASDTEAADGQGEKSQASSDAPQRQEANGRTATDRLMSENLTGMISGVAGIFEVLDSTDTKAQLIQYFVTFAFAWVLAAGHLASWNINFQRTQGQFWWRTFSVALVVASGASLLSRLIGTVAGRRRGAAPAATPRPDPEQGQGQECDREDPGDERTGEIATRFAVPRVLEMYTTIAFVASSCVYLVARVGLIILVVYSFWSLPKGAYKVAGSEWLQFLPFIH